MSHNIDWKFSETITQKAEAKSVNFQLSYALDDLDLFCDRADSFLATYVSGAKSNMLSHYKLSANYDSLQAAIDAYLEDAVMGREDVLIFTVYKYEHREIKLSLKPFECRFDSAISGFAVVKKSDLNHCDLIKHEDKLKQIIEAELSMIQAVQNGNVYDLALIDADGEVIDSLNQIIATQAADIDNIADEMLSAVASA